MKKLCHALLVVLVLLLAASPVLASVVTNARFSGIIRVANAGDSVSGVSANMTLDSPSFTSNGYSNSDMTDIAIQINGADTAFMPGYDGNPWAIFIPTIGEIQNIVYDLFSGNVTDGKIRYFPGDGGMTTPDHDTLELGLSWYLEQKGWVDTANTSASPPQFLVVKDDAFYSWISGTGNITSGISGNWTTPTGTNDPDTQWTDDAKAIDGLTATFAHDTVGVGAWTSYLEISFTSPIWLDNIRTWTANNPTTREIDIWTGAGWQNVVSEADTSGAWQTSDLGSLYNASLIRIRLFSAAGGEMRLNEIQFGRIFTVTASGVSSGEITVGTEALTDVWLDHDGTNQYGTISDNASISALSPLSIEFWAKTNTNKSWMAFLTKYFHATDLEWAITEYSTDNNTIAFRVFDDTGGGYKEAKVTTNIFDGEWHHLVGTWDGDVTFTWYTDGSSASFDYALSGNMTAIQNTTADLYLGRQGNLAARDLVGSIDEVRIYERVVPEAEALANYNLGRTGKPTPSNLTDLVAWHRIDAGTGASTTDEIYNNDGTITAATWGDASALNIYIDDVLEDTGTLVTVPDNSATWTFAENYSLLYLEYQDITIDGTQAQYITWEYATTFSDQSVNSNDATPTFRVTSSDIDVTAELVSFEPVTLAVVDSFTVAGTVNILTGSPDAIPQMYTELDFENVPGAEAVNEILSEGGIPQALWWYPFLYIGIVIIGFLTYEATTLRVSSGRISPESAGNGSLLVMFIVMEALIAIFGIMNPVPFWPALLFPIAAIAIIVSQKHFSWG